MIITISGFATIGSLFLFNSNSKPELQSTDIVEAVTTPKPFTTPKRFDLGSSKRSNLGDAPTSLPSTAQIPSPTFISSPTLTTTPAPAPLPSITPTITLTPTQTPISTSTLSPSPSSGSSPSTTTTPEPSAKININTANNQELQKITGVGPVIAQRIIDYRNKNGPFQTIEDLKKVNGIGDVNFEKMKNEITI